MDSDEVDSVHPIAKHRLSCIPLIAGVDEAGRGPLAGPVVAAAVIISDGNFPDSKAISPAKRVELYHKILTDAVSISISAVPPFIIDKLDIRKASLLAMRNAVLGLAVPPTEVLVDGRDEIPALDIPQKPVIGGDSKISAIGAASIVAKVARDALMKAYSTQFPQYGFEKHKGYPTKKHYIALGEFGNTIIHRISFRLR